MVKKDDWNELIKLTDMINKKAKRRGIDDLQLLLRLSEQISNQVYKLMALRDNETMKDYCSQNNGECSSCSLVSYGRDCMNNLIGK